MKTAPVTSSNIAEIGYDPSRREMRVMFKGGAVHDHVDVPPEHFAGIMSAESHGKYYNAHIKGRFASRKVGDPRAPMPDEPNERPRIDEAKRARPVIQGDAGESLTDAIRRYKGEQG